MQTRKLRPGRAAVFALALVLAGAVTPGSPAAWAISLPGPEAFDVILTPQAPVPAAPAIARDPLQELAVTLHHLAPGLDPRAIERALDAAKSAQARGVKVQSDLLTVIDYTRPSWETRLWVFDTKRPRVLFSDRCAHGANTGVERAEHFSNVVGSKQTSLGLFLTGDPYVGDNGYSLRLHGLDGDLNSRAYERAIVMHGAPYVSDEFMLMYGRIGRSWGCPAVSAELAKPLIDTIRGGSLVYAYHDANKAR